MEILTPYNIGEVVIALITIIGNVTVLIAILKNRHLHTPTNVFIGHLATADVIVGVLVCPLAIVTNLHLEMDFHSCILLNSVLKMFSGAENIMLFCITFERFAAIRYPMKYHEIMDMTRANYIALTAWGIGFLVGLIPMFGWNAGVENYGGKCHFLAIISFSYLVYFSCFCMFLVPVTLMTFVYVYIWRVVRRHRSASNSLQSRFNVRLQKKEGTTKPLIVVIVVFFVSQVPLKTLHCLSFYEVSPWSPADHYKLELISLLLDRSSAMVNPFIYAASTSKMKAAMLNVVLCRPMNTDISLTLSSRASPFNLKRITSEAAATIGRPTENTETKQGYGANQTPVNMLDMNSTPGTSLPSNASISSPSPSTK